MTVSLDMPIVHRTTPFVVATDEIRLKAALAVGLSCTLQRVIARYPGRSCSNSACQIVSEARLQDSSKGFRGRFHR
jgi:hypothetical protein